MDITTTTPVRSKFDGFASGVIWHITAPLAMVRLENVQKCHGRKLRSISVYRRTGNSRYSKWMR